MTSLRARLDEINAELAALNEEHYKISLQVANEQREQDAALFDSWKVSEGSNIVLVAKQDRGFHWTLIKTMTVKEVDLDHGFMSTITTDYHESDYEYWCKSECNRVSFDQLRQLQSDYTVYIVEEPELHKIQRQMLDLEFTYQNFNVPETHLREVAIAIIS